MTEHIYFEDSDVLIVIIFNAITTKVVSYNPSQGEVYSNTTICGKHLSLISGRWMDFRDQ